MLKSITKRVLFEYAAHARAYLVTRVARATAVSREQLRKSAILQNLLKERYINEQCFNIKAPADFWHN